MSVLEAIGMMPYDFSPERLRCRDLAEELSDPRLTRCLMVRPGTFTPVGAQVWLGCTSRNHVRLQGGRQMLIEVAGVRVPVGRATQAARLVCEEYADDALYHHSVRSYFFGAAWAETRGLDFDRELFFVSALLHDLALTPPFDSHTLSFEEAGGHLARVFTAGLGWPTERRDRAAELIVLHMRDDVAPEADVESRLLQVGTSADVSGAGLEAFDASFRDALVEAYPRLGFAKSFVHLFQRQAERKPGCAAAELVAGGWPERALSNLLDQG